MSSRPDISYNASGEVTLSVTYGESTTIYQRYSPDVADILANRLRAMAEGARKMLRDMDRRQESADKAADGAALFIAIELKESAAGVKVVGSLEVQPESAGHFDPLAPLADPIADPLAGA